MNYFTVLAIVSLGFATTLSEDCDNTERPYALKEKEDYCWKDQVEIIERIQQTSKSVLNFAKKKLGIEVEDKPEPQKCEYYFCLMQKLNFLNPNGFPVYDKIEGWIEEEVVLKQGKELIMILDKCTNALANATMEDRPFYGETIEIDLTDVGDVVDEGKLQSNCEISKQFIKCLAQQKCGSFVFP